MSRFARFYALASTLLLLGGCTGNNAPAGGGPTSGEMKIVAILGDVTSALDDLAARL